MPLAWTCLEVDCGQVVEAGDEDALVAAVNEHMRAAHASFEMEDAILDVAVKVDD